MSLASSNKKLGLKELVSIGIGGMIGGGIFAVLGLSLQLAGTAAFLAFLIAGLIALLTGYSYSKLSVEFPSRGGTVEFLAKGIQNQLFLGTLTIMLLLGYIVMIALYAYAFGAYAASTFHGSLEIAKTLGALAIAAFVLVNALGAVVSGKVEDQLVIFKLSVLLLVSLLGFKFANFAKLNPATWPSLVKILTGGLIIFLAYEGFELISHASKDSDNLKHLEKSFYISILTVIAVYVIIALISSVVLTPSEVEKFRDYALAILAKKELGISGFWLVVAAALASTASAINATLFGTAGISYIVAKLGELPESMGKKIWKNAPEGLFIIAIISIILLYSLNLKEISFAGSASFLLIFFFINYTAFKLSKRLRIKRIIPALAMLLIALALAIMSYYSLAKEPRQVAIFLLLFFLSFATEAIYRKLTNRKISFYLDRSLKEREEFVNSWKEKISRIKQFLFENNIAKEVYVPKSLVEKSRLEKPELELLIVPHESQSLNEKSLHELLISKGLVTKHLPLKVKIVEKLEKELEQEFARV